MSRVYILYKSLCFYVPYSTELYRIQYSIFISNPGYSEANMKASGDVAGIVPYLSRYYTVRVKLFSLFFVFFLMCYLYEAYYKPITVQC